LNKEELQDLAKAGNIKVRDLINNKSAVLKDLNVELSSLTDDDAFTMIADNPKILRRPLLLTDNRLIFGFKTDQYGEIT